MLLVLHIMEIFSYKSMGSAWDGDSEGMAVRNESGRTEVSRWLGTKLMWRELVFVSSSSHECKLFTRGAVLSGQQYRSGHLTTNSVKNYSAVKTINVLEK